MSDIPFNYAGTADNPIVWKDGMTAYPNFYYTKDGVRKIWTGRELLEHRRPKGGHA